MLKTIKRIRKQQERMGYAMYTQHSPENQMDYLRDIALALMKEVGEFLDEVPWKPWRKFDEQDFNKIEAIHEICDIIVFAIVLYITLDPPLALEDAMEDTLNKIDRRIKQGYGRKEEK